jgi:two-component system LytT family sensor kinase
MSPALRRFLLEPFRHGPRSRAYWIASTIAWTGYALINLSALFGLGKLTSGSALDVASLAVIQFATTHYLLGTARQYDWHSRPLHYSIPRMLGLIAVLTVTSLLMSIGTTWLIKHSGLFEMPEPDPSMRMTQWVWYVLPAINLGILYILAAALDFIGQAFRRLREREVEQWKTEAALKAAELRQLKNQINPHFTFNALNNIRALISEDPQRARQMVTHLAEVLRYVLYHAERESVTLDQELEVVTAYLALEAIQQEERLRLEWHVSPEAQSLRLPPMLLQILVENAIKHGISRRPEGGTLTVRARSDADALHLEVSNPGNLTAAPAQGGIGLDYARERLRLSCGGELTLWQKHDEVCASLRIPQTAAVPA